MDFSPIIEPVIKGVMWVIPVLLVIAFFKSAYFKGFLGEQLVRFAMWLQLDEKTYRRFHNVILETRDGTTQIDHVIVSRFGVFVIETKNLQGWIFGRENQGEWTQKIFKQSYKFQNPLRQNYRHVKALEETLQIPPQALHSVVSFVGECELKSPMPPNVTQGGQLIRYVKSFQTPLLTDTQVDAFAHRLNRMRLAPAIATTRAHVADLKTREARKQTNRCPTCSSPMVERTAKKGAYAGKVFWGCSAYPRCRTIINTHE